MKFELHVISSFHLPAFTTDFCFQLTDIYVVEGVMLIYSLFITCRRNNTSILTQVEYHHLLADDVLTVLYDLLRSRTLVFPRTDDRIVTLAVATPSTPIAQKIPWRL